MLSDNMLKKINGLPVILSPKEVAEFFSVHYLTVCRQIRADKLPAYKDDEGNWCIIRSDLKKFCSNNCNL